MIRPRSFRLAMTVSVDDDSDITHIPILCSRICYVSIFVSIFFLLFSLSQPFSCHVSLKIAYGTRSRRKNNRPMFHPLNHLSITVEKGKGVSTRRVPPCWTTVVTRRICSAHNYEGAAARWHVYIFQNHRYTPSTRESVCIPRIYPLGRVRVRHAGDRKCRDRPYTVSFMATEYQPPIRRIRNGRSTFSHS